MDKDGGVHALSALDWQQRRKHLAQLGGSPLPTLEIPPSKPDLPKIAPPKPDPPKPDPLDHPGSQIAYRFGPGMQVGLAVGDGKTPRQRITYYDDGKTNSTLLQVDGKTLLFGSVAGKWEPRLAPLGKGPDGKERRGHQSTWVHGKLKVIQSVEVVSSGKGSLDTCLIRYEIVNQDDKAHTVALRSLVDTFIVDNDGHPFTVPGQKELITTQADFTGKDLPPFVQALQRNDVAKPGLVAYFTLKVGGGLEAPDRFSITTWDKTKLFAWDVPVRDISGDAAVVLYWNARELKAGERRLLGYAYGKGVVTLDDAGKGKPPAP
jgi:hypothetical protein